MSGQFLARLMLSVLAGGQGLAPLVIDLNRTHATHPLWPGHARFHVVWQTLTSSLLSAVEIALIWWPFPHPRLRASLAAALIASPLLAFSAAAALRRLYGGTLHDPRGIPPLRLRMGRHALELDGNALAVAAGWLVLAAAVLLLRLSR